MASTDDQATAAAKAGVATPTTLNAPTTLEFDEASHTHMRFFYENDVIACEATLKVNQTGGDADAKIDLTRRIQRFPMEEALPADLQAAAQLIHAYLHNRAVELANSEDS